MPDYRLHFRGMLGRRGNEHRTVFTPLRPGSVCFEVKMFLAAELENAFERHRRFCERSINIAATNEIRRVMEAPVREGFLHGQDRSQWLAIDPNFFRSG